MYINTTNQRIPAFEGILNFINNKIIPKYPQLKECIQLKTEDDEDKIYLIKYEGNMTFDEEQALRKKIVKNIDEFCLEANIASAFYEINIILSR